MLCTSDQSPPPVLNWLLCISDSQNILREIALFFRSTTSTPSVAMELDVVERNISAGISEEAEKERAAMLNVMMEVAVEFSSRASRLLRRIVIFPVEDITTTETPPPTVEVVQSNTGTSLTLMVPTASSADKGKLVVQPDTPYRWKEWRVMRGDESTFIWCDVLALELRFVTVSRRVHQ